MKLFLFIALICASTSYAQVRANVILHAGMLAQKLTSDPEGWRNNARIGFQGGLMFRLGGGRIYLEPGVNWYVMSQDLFYPDDNNLTIEQKANQSVHGVNVPVLLGASLIHTKFFELRLKSGPSFTFPTGTKGVGPMERNDIADCIWGFRAGVGIDIWRFTFDLDYELGISKFYAKSLESKARSNVITASVGLKLGKNGK